MPLSELMVDRELHFQFVGSSVFCSLGNSDRKLTHPDLQTLLVSKGYVVVSHLHVVAFHGDFEHGTGAFVLARDISW